jgi:hypothetical protein
MKTQGGSDAKVALIGCMGAIIAAIIGLGTPVVDRLLDRLIPPPATVIAAPPTIAPTSIIEEVVQPPAPPTPTFALELPTQPMDSSPSPPPLPDDPPANIAFDPPATTQVTPQMHEAIANFLAYANQVEIYTRFTGDMTYAYDVFGDEWLNALQDDIAAIAEQGQVQLSYFDGPNSAIRNISIVDDVEIQVDTCEIWSATYYRLPDYSIVNYRPAELLPQTITLEYTNDSWLITYVEHYTAPHFCQ